VAVTETGHSMVNGVVVTGDGWPIPHAVVTVVDGSGGQAGRSIAGADGRFAVSRLDTGTYTLIVAAAGHTPQARTCMVNGTEPIALGPLVLAKAGAGALPAPGRWHLDPIHSRISATAIHLGFAKIHGRFREFSGTIHVAQPLERSSVEVVIAAASIDTDNPDRDAHLRSPDFLDVAAYPEIRYTSGGLTRLTDASWTLEGQLTMKNLTRAVPLQVNYLGSGPDGWGGTRAGFSATTQLDRDHYGMIWNQSVLAGVLAVGRTLRITIDIEAVDQQLPTPDSGSG
jgi:polyisoprenoid-binding protein YceI